MEGEFIFNLLSNIAAPVAICFYTLFEVNKNVKQLSDTIATSARETNIRLNKLEVEVQELRFRVETLAHQN